MKLSKTQQDLARQTIMSAEFQQAMGHRLGGYRVDSGACRSCRELLRCRPRCLLPQRKQS